MANKNYRSRQKKSVCELSLLLVANIIRLATLRFADAGGLSRKTNLSNPKAQEDHHHIVSQEANDVDENATNYINKIRGKINGNAAGNAASKYRLRPSETSNMVK